MYILSALLTHAPNEMKAIILVCALAILLTIAIGFVTWKRKAKKSTVVICGPMNAGKTVLWLTLRQRLGQDASGAKAQLPLTVTSTTPNVSENSKYVLVDTPGHPKLRYIANNLHGAAYVFVLDTAASGTSHSVRPEAEYLYELLGSRSKVPVLVACNKAELFSSIPVPRLKNMLQEEMQLLRKSQAASIGKMDEQEASGLLDTPFTFDDYDIEFIQGSAKNGVSAWQMWIERHV